jgi:hypothetical protein
LPPNINGLITWTDGADIFSQMISLGVYTNDYPSTVFQWSGTRWLMSIIISSSSYSSGVSFNLYLNILN